MKSFLVKFHQAKFSRLRTGNIHGAGQLLKNDKCQIFRKFKPKRTLSDKTLQQCISFYNICNEINSSFYKSKLISLVKNLLKYKYCNRVIEDISNSFGCTHYRQPHVYKYYSVYFYLNRTHIVDR